MVHKILKLQVALQLNYIIAISMKEGKGSQCQEGQQAYQEPKTRLT